MASTIEGFTTNEIKSQPLLVINSSENEGWMATHQMIFRAQDFADCAPQFNKGNLLSDVEPDVPPPFDSFLRITTVNITRIEGDLYEVTINASGGGTNQFEGDEDLSEGVIPTYTLNGQLTEVDILQHPKAIEIRDNELSGLRLHAALLEDPDGWFYDWNENQLYRVADIDASFYPAPVSALGPDGEYPIFVESEDAIQLAKRIALGQITYLKCVYTWTETTEGPESLTADQLNKLGQISTPRGNPPTPSGNRQWMLTGASQSQTGELYRTTLTWTLSDEGGYNEFLYSDE